MFCELGWIEITNIKIYSERFVGHSQLVQPPYVDRRSGEGRTGFFKVSTNSTADSWLDPWSNQRSRRRDESFG